MAMEVVEQDRSRIYRKSYDPTATLYYNGSIRFNSVADQKLIQPYQYCILHFERTVPAVGLELIDPAQAQQVKYSRKLTRANEDGNGCVVSAQSVLRRLGLSIPPTNPLLPMISDPDRKFLIISLAPVAGEDYEPPEGERRELRSNVSSEELDRIEVNLMRQDPYGSIITSGNRLDDSEAESGETDDEEVLETQTILVD